MECSTENAGQRLMVFLPEINSRSLLLFHKLGDSPISWRLYDYSDPQHVTEREAQEFGWPADEVQRRARYCFAAPAVNDNSLNFWHEYTREGNKLILGVTG